MAEKIRMERVTLPTADFKKAGISGIKGIDYPKIKGEKATPVKITSI